MSLFGLTPDPRRPIVPVESEALPTTAAGLDVLRTCIEIANGTADEPFDERSRLVHEAATTMLRIGDIDRRRGA